MDLCYYETWWREAVLFMRASELTHDLKQYMKAHTLLNAKTRLVFSLPNICVHTIFSQDPLSVLFHILRLASSH